jgi:hypothetical protein
VEYLLKARTVEPEKDPLLGNTRTNNRGIVTKRDVTCTAVAMEQWSKHISVATNTHTTIEEPTSKQWIGKHTAIWILLETVFSVRSEQSGYKEEFS